MRNDSFEVIKEGSILSNITVKNKAFNLIGRVEDLCDIYIDNPSVSRKHAILQFKEGEDLPYIYDLGGTHGTYVNKQKLPGKVYKQVAPFDSLKFGVSSRIYVLRCPVIEAKEQQIEDAESISFKNMLSENKKELSKKELKQKYLDLLENDPYYKANNQARKFIGSNSKQQDDGIDWGISDQYEVYAYRNESEFQIEPDLIRRLPGLDQIQLNKIAEYEQNLQKYEQNEGQMNELLNKQKREYGLEQKLRERKQKVERRLIESLESLQRSEDWIRVNIFGEIKERVGGKMKKQKEGDTFEDDEFYDRTIVNKKVGKVEERKERKVMMTVEDYWKLEKQFRYLLRQLREVEKELEKEALQYEKVDSEGEENDNLDAYMKQNNENLQKQEISKLDERRKQVMKELGTIKQQLLPMAGQKQLDKIERQERGIREEESEEERRDKIEHRNRKKIGATLEQLQIIKQSYGQQEVDEEDVKIFEFYQQEKWSGEKVAKRVRDEEADEDLKKYERVVTKYPIQYIQRNKQSDKDGEYFDLTKLQ